MPVRPRRRAAAAALVLAVAAAAGCTGNGADDREPAAGRAPGLTRAEQRAAWADRTPSGWGPTLGELAHARDIVAGFSNRELAGQLIVADFAGSAAPVDRVRRFSLGGVIVGSQNDTDPARIGRLITRLQEATRRPWPLVVSVDQEGGTVSRIGPPLTQFPTFMSLGAAGRPKLAREVAEASGRELRALGFTMVYAPDADVTIGAADPTIRSRSAGDDARQVAAIVRSSLEGYRRAGIVAVLKHFPGHGSVTRNSHRALPHQGATVGALAARDFRPFAAGVAAHAPAVMMGHISLDRVDRGIPAGLSAPGVGLLRDDLGFAGLITTDALNMAAVTQRFGPARAAVLALRAGADQLLMPADLGAAYRGILAALRAGRLDRDDLEASAARVGALMLHSAIRAAPPRRVVGSHAGLSRRVSSDALAVVTGRCQGPYVGSSVRPTGEPYLVEAFARAAARAGLTLRRHGSTVALMGERAPRRKSDVAVAVAAPYVLADARADTRLALFGWTPEAMDALVAALRGDARLVGRLPVAVPRLDTPRC